MQDWFYEQLAMYGAYHRDARNQATHHVGVPMIVFSLLLATSFVPLFTTASGSYSLALLLLALLLLAYSVAVPVIGLLAALFYGLLLVIASGLTGLGASGGLSLAAGLFVLGWAIQFWGHAFEGRRPALFDNILQIFMAPAFLIAELLFAAGMLVGLQSEMKARMGAYLPPDDTQTHDAAA